MTTRKIPFATDEFYHIYNRGNSKQEIFLDDKDRDRFTKLLFLCNSNKNVNFRDDIVSQKIDAFDFNRGDTIVSIGAWVLMPNHFHLYLTNSPRCHLGEEAIPLFIKKLCTAYSMYFNKRHQRIGKLFEGSFKSVHVISNEQAKYLFSYIHLNPLKLIDPLWKESVVKNTNKFIEFLSKYKWGSYKDYNGIKRSENIIISRKDFPDYFNNQALFVEEVFDWLTTGSLGVTSGE